jgi:hypothetical protein
MMLLVAVLLAASAQERRPHPADRTPVWEELHYALMVEAVDGTPAVAAQLLTETLGDLGPGDPFRAELLFWLGRSQMEIGKVEEARASFQESADMPIGGDAARTALAAMDIEQEQLTRLPLTCTFDADDCGVVRAWSGTEKGELAIRDASDAVVLAWDTTVEPGETDGLHVGLAPGLTLRRIVLQARATAFPADLRLTAVDASGARFSAPMVRVASDRWTSWSSTLEGFAPITPGILSRSPRQVRVIEIEDLTALLSTDRGPNTILIDDLVLE